MRLMVSFTGILSAIFFSLFSSFYTAEKSISSIRPFRAKQCKAIVFDLGGVLFDTSKKQTFWEIGPKNLFWFWKNSGCGEIAQLRDRLYDLCDAVRNHSEEKPRNQYNLKDGLGIELPQLLAEWLRGTKPNKSFMQEINQFAKENPEWFKNSAEQRVMKNVVRVTFTPQTFIKTRMIYQETADLIKECKDRGFKLFVCSNWDGESAKLLVEKYPEVFDNFDKLIFSGEVKSVKPEPEIFDHITQELSAEECIFIDDQRENIKAARELGFKAILVQNENGLLGSQPNIQAVRDQLAQVSPSFESESSQNSIYA